MTVVNIMRTQTENSMRTVLLTILVLVAISCTDSVIEPRPVSHEFTWEIDTILPNAFQFIGRSIWGDRETNVYLVGHDSDGHQSMLRWDGKKWNTIDLWRFGFNTIAQISGYDSSNIAIVGTGGRWGHIGVYKNGTWDTLRSPRLGPGLNSVHMVSPGEIYVAGLEGILKYNESGYQWIVDSTASQPGPTGPQFYPGDVRKGPDGMLYFTTYNTLDNGKNVLRLYMYDDAQVKLINESIEWDTGRWNFGFYLRQVGDKLLSGTSSIYSVRRGVINKEHEVAGVFMTGTDPDRNLFAVSQKNVLHLNGVDWADITPIGVEISQLPFPIHDGVYIDSTLFLIVVEGNRTLIYRGSHITK
jgi:hypothetical protein